VAHLIITRVRVDFCSQCRQIDRITPLDPHRRPRTASFCHGADLSTTVELAVRVWGRAAAEELYFADAAEDEFSGETAWKQIVSRTGMRVTREPYPFVLP
jgi:hypothetical protein